MKKIILSIAVAIFILSSCRPTRGYETNTKNFIGYGTYQPPHKKGLDR